MPAFFSQDDLASIESVVRALRKHLAEERRQADKIFLEPVSISRAKATSMRAAVDATSDAKQRCYDRLHEIIVGAGYWPRSDMCLCGAPKPEPSHPPHAILMVKRSVVDGPGGHGGCGK